VTRHMILEICTWIPAAALLGATLGKPFTHMRLCHQAV